MDQNSSPAESIAYKMDFLQKYSSVPRIIKPNSSCYAISNEWFTIFFEIWFKNHFRWSNFECLLDIAQMETDMPLGNPGPINNLPIV